MKTHTRKTIIAALTALFLAVLACNAPQASPTADIGAMVVQTQTAIALEKFLTATASATQTTPTKPPQSATPEPQTTPTHTMSPTPDCTDAAKFDSETVPDETSFSPGQEFVKTWILRNVGTCTWNPDYALTFVEGDRMGGTSPAPIGQTVPPDGLIEIRLPQTAPEEPGEYQGFWKLQNDRGDKFGIGDDANVAFWVMVTVVDVGGGPEMGPPTWVDDFKGERKYWPLGEDQHTNFEIEDNKLIITAYGPTGDLWRVANTGNLSDFYMEAIFTTGELCAGKDGYGLLVRAPDQPDGIIDSGYVFGFSCDGHYRIYRIDNGGYTALVEWTASPYILPGLEQTNKMGVQAVGETLQLYANGTLLAEVEDDAYAVGIFGLMIRSEVTSGFQVIVSQVAYWE